RDDMGTPRLCRGLDTDKDQSYVLFGTLRERLNSMLLPIGEMRKSQVRELAKELDLPVFDKPDSQEICFVPDNDYAGLIHRRTPQEVSEGDLLDTAGNVIGRHPGQQHFTIGQRRGVGLAMGMPVYVVDKDAARNTVTIGPREQLLATGLRAGQTHWLVEPLAVGEVRECHVKIRYNSAPVQATVMQADVRHLGSSLCAAAAIGHPRSGSGCVRWRCRAGRWLDRCGNSVVLGFQCC
ncbi:MAG: hypothetical protein HC898_07025, partial [Phycisphaerales bacterium]|nr:hypothetical protein [Phycisphaerales bacterium]